MNLIFCFWLFLLGRQLRPTDLKPLTLSVKSKSSDSSDNQRGAQPKRPITSSRSTGALASDEIPADPLMSQDLKAGENQVSRSFSHEKISRRGLCSGRVPLSEAQVQLLVGLYYLPHEHGPPAQNLLQDLTWLKANCHCVSVNGNGKKASPQKVKRSSLLNIFTINTHVICFVFNKVDYIEIIVMILHESGIWLRFLLLIFGLSGRGMAGPCGPFPGCVWWCGFTAWCCCDQHQ